LNTNNTQVVALVNAIFNVAPGYTYLSNFAGYAAQNGVAKTADALAGLAGQTDAAFTTSLIANLGLTGEAATVATAYFTARFAAKASQGTVAMEAVTYLASAAAKADATFGAAATAFAATVERSEIYSTNSANTSTDLTVLANASAGKLPQSFTLTAGDDTFTGGAGNDTFAASEAAKYSASRDVIDGGAGTDTFSLTMTAASVTPETKNMEKLQFLMTDGTAGTAATSTIALSAKATGVTSVEFYNYTGSTTGTEDTVAVTGVTTETLRLVSGDGEYHATWTLKDATGTADTARVEVSDVSVDKLTVDGVETLTIDAQGTATAGNKIVSIDADALTKLVVTGAGKVNLGDLEDTGKAFTVDASANTGGVTIDVSTQTPLADTKKMTLTGGAGADTFKVLETDIDGDTGTTRYYSVDAGAGVDTIEFAGAVAGLTAADLKKGLASFTNYEKVKFVAETANVNLSTTGLQGKILVSGGNELNVINAASGLEIELAAAASSGIQVAFAGAGVKTATLNLKGYAGILENTGGAGATAFAGVQNLAITNTATTSTDVELADIDDYVGAQITLSGNGGIDLDSDALSTSTVQVSAAAMTDSVAVKTSTTGTVVATGSGADTITVSAFSIQDDVNAGAGNDTISLLEDDGATTATNAVVLTDIIAGGDGTDTLQLVGDADMNVTTDITGMTITNVEKLEVAKANTAKTHVLTMNSAQSIAFAGTKTAAADLGATTDAVAPTVTVKMAAADTAVSGTALVDTFVAATSQVGFTVTGGAANDVVDLGNLTTANWGNAAGALADVNASTEWYFDNATDTLSVWDDIATKLIAIKLTGVATVTATNETFVLATLDA
jgi:hypothetical protein